jgi:hypothetical protein
VPASAKGTGIKFRTKLLSAGKTATGFEVPAAVVDAMGAGKRPPVKVTINGFTYRNTVAVYGGKFLIGVSAENRDGAKVSAGDMLDVTLELDSAPREVEVPTDFKAALRREPRALKAFEALSYSHKRAHTLAIEAAKAPETRARRISKSVEALKAGQK